MSLEAELNQVVNFVQPLTGIYLSLMEKKIQCQKI